MWRGCRSPSRPRRRCSSSAPASGRRDVVTCRVTTADGSVSRGSRWSAGAWPSRRSARTVSARPRGRGWASQGRSKAASVAPPVSPRPATAAGSGTSSQQRVEGVGQPAAGEPFPHRVGDRCQRAERGGGRVGQPSLAAVSCADPHLLDPVGGAQGQDRRGERMVEVAQPADGRLAHVPAGVAGGEHELEGRPVAVRQALRGEAGPPRRVEVAPDRDVEGGPELGRGCGQGLFGVGEEIRIVRAGGREDQSREGAALPAGANAFAPACSVLVMAVGWVVWVLVGWWAGPPGRSVRVAGWAAWVLVGVVDRESRALVEVAGGAA